MSCACVRELRLKLAIFCWSGGEAWSVPNAWMTPLRSSGAIHVAVVCRTLCPSRGLIQRGIMGGAEQLPLFDSPVSGMVLAPRQGAQQECNRPDQLRQCRDHCYSDLGFLLPATTSPPLGLAMVFSHCPVTSSQRNRSPAGMQVSRGRCRGGSTIVALCIVISGTDVRRALSQTPVTWTPPAPPARRRSYWGHERTNEHHPSHVRVYSCPNVQLTPTSANP